MQKNHVSPAKRGSGSFSFQPIVTSSANTVTFPCCYLTGVHLQHHQKKKSRLDRFDWQRPGRGLDVDWWSPSVSKVPHTSKQTNTVIRLCFTLVSDSLFLFSFIMCLSFWQNSQPDNGGGRLGEEDCAHIITGRNDLKNWNDLACNSSLMWICEKMI